MRVPVEARFPLRLLAGFVVIGVVPTYRQDWSLENVPQVLAMPMLVLAWCNPCFSKAAYARLFEFFVLHEIGAHDTCT